MIRRGSESWSKIPSMVLPSDVTFQVPYADMALVPATNYLQYMIYARNAATFSRVLTFQARKDRQAAVVAESGAPWLFWLRQLFKRPQCIRPCWTRLKLRSSPAELAGLRSSRTNGCVLGFQRLWAQSARWSAQQSHCCQLRHNSEISGCAAWCEDSVALRGHRQDVGIQPSLARRLQIRLACCSEPPSCRTSYVGYPQLSAIRHPQIRTGAHVDHTQRED